MPMQIARSRTTYSPTYEGPPRVTYDVLVDGVEYRCTSADLRLLYEGILPDDLGLVPLDEERSK